MASKREQEVADLATIVKYIGRGINTLDKGDGVFTQDMMDYATQQTKLSKDRVKRFFSTALQIAEAVGIIESMEDAESSDSEDDTLQPDSMCGSCGGRNKMAKKAKKGPSGGKCRRNGSGQRKKLKSSKKAKFGQKRKKSSSKCGPKQKKAKRSSVKKRSCGR